MDDPRADDPSHVSQDDPNSLAELLQELRILLQGAQVLAGFLVILPFSQRFAAISALEKGLYLGAFLCTLASLILFSAPALHHRLERPLSNRIRFKNFASRMTVLGAVPLSCAIPMAAHVAIGEIASTTTASAMSGLVAAGILFVWWLSPRIFLKERPGRA